MFLPSVNVSRACRHRCSVQSKGLVVNLCIGAGWLFANPEVGGWIRETLRLSALCSCGI